MWVQTCNNKFYMKKITVVTIVRSIIYIISLINSKLRWKKKSTLHLDTKFYCIVKTDNSSIYIDKVQTRNI